MCIGLVGRVLRTLDQDRQLVEVDIAGARRQVNGALLGLDQLAPGTYVLINAGLAVETISEEDATEQIRLLEELEASVQDVAAPSVSSEAI
jgi:hydrogenase assembly chaperone HypC/HupF